MEEKTYNIGGIKFGQDVILKDAIEFLEGQNG